MNKYLQHYAEPEVAALDDLPGQAAWENVVVIPACDETAGLLRSPPPCGGRSLMILVINEPENAAQDVSAANQALAAAVQQRFAPVWQSVPVAGLSLWQDTLAERDLLLVDRFSERRRLPARGGVGFARKIGADLALSLIQRQRINSAWIHCTDADVRLPKNYFTRSNTLEQTASKYSALIYPFSHTGDLHGSESGDVVRATQLYELSLRYYVAGMKFARSPYAFHTIGSTMAVSATHYAKVRGFPRREAGEDFYLLNKLAKVGVVLELEAGAESDLIEIESRRSDRVPFGTGAAVNKITGFTAPLSEFRFYDPAVFGLIRVWLESFPGIWGSGVTVLDNGIFHDVAVEKQGHELQCLLDGLKVLKTDQALEHSFRQSKSLDQFTRQMHTWFDAFRTLKLIHFLRDMYLPSIAYARLKTDPVYQQLLKRDPDLLAFHEQLRKNLETNSTAQER